MTKIRRMVFVPAIAAVFALGLFAVQALPAFACGGLVAPNGAVRLSRATTFVAWHNGIERYLTAFTYQGDVSNLGLLVTQCSFATIAGTVTSMLYRYGHSPVVG